MGFYAHFQLFSPGASGGRWHLSADCPSLQPAHAQRPLAKQPSNQDLSLQLATVALPNEINTVFGQIGVKQTDQFIEADRQQTRREHDWTAAPVEVGSIQPRPHGASDGNVFFRV